MQAMAERTSASSPELSISCSMIAFPPGACLPGRAHGFHVSAPCIAIAVCELKKSRSRLRASGRAVKMVGREVCPRLRCRRDFGL
jgi:hypothetical protein